jgi:hypothetical protein
MALDWCILGPTGAPEIAIAMGPDAHHEFMVRVGHLPLLARAADYYGDSEYSPAEVSGLLEELASVAPLGGAAVELVALCEEAVRRGQGIVTLAD